MVFYNPFLYLERQWQGVTRQDAHGVNKWAPSSIFHLNEGKQR